MSDTLLQLFEQVCNEASFLDFARALAADRRSADLAPVTAEGFQHEWANQDIAAFISGAVAWAEDSDFAARPGPKPSNPWALFAAFLWAGRMYE